MSTLIAVLFDGLSYGMLLFLLSVGLSVTLGLMNFTNLAHGAFAMLGGYVTYALVELAGWPFLATLPFAFIVTAIIAAGFEIVLFRRIYKSGELNQVLLTIGVVFASYAVAAFFFGTVHHSVELPGYLKGFVEIGALKLPSYRIFLVVVALLITAVLVGVLEYTRFGAMVRAAVDNGKVASGLGLNISVIFALTFALGSGLAGLGGALAINILFIDPNFGFHVLVPVLIVVSIGGLGSIWGSFVAAAALGIFDVVGKFLFPEVGAFLIYLFMVVILFFRPNGLFARR
jgi:branched-chain amino acid transport system permease protein